MSSRLRQGNQRVDTADQPATRQRSRQVGTVGEQMAIDHAIDRSEQDIGKISIKHKHFDALGEIIR